VDGLPSRSNEAEEEHQNGHCHVSTHHVHIPHNNQSGFTTRRGEIEEPAFESGRTIRDVAREESGLDETTLQRLLDSRGTDT
jgi:hypothetical protein